MAPNKKTASSSKRKPKATTKKQPKRKREPSESDNLADSNEELEDEDVDMFEGDKNGVQNDSNKYGKFQKFNKDKLWKLNKIPHHLLASFNITGNTDINDVRDFPLVETSLPYSVYVNSKLPDNVDICHRRTIALNSYMHRLKSVKIAYLSAKKKKKNVRKDEKNGIYCKSLVDFAERRELHPDKYFVRDYDFYYTGGNLSVNPKSSLIAHVGGSNMNTLVVSVFNVQNNLPKVHRINSIDFKSDTKESEIFEVAFSTSDDDYIFMRQKKCISIQHYGNGKINLVQNFKSKEVPFISFSQDPVYTHHLAISDLAHKIRLCDVERGVPIQTLKMMAKEQIKPSNNWNKIRSLESHVYIYSTCKSVSIIDTRLKENEWQTSTCGSVAENGCYNFCSLARSRFEHLFYIGSNHKVYCVDRRFMGQDVDSKNGAVSTWTHQMSSFPLMMATSCHEDNEYIILQSPISSDLRICENMQFLQETDTTGGKTKKPRTDLPLEYAYKSPCLPYMPPSIETVFQEARLKGKCIKPATGIVDRVKACITGLDFTDNIANTYLLTATSNGDLFARHMYDHDADCKPSTFTASDVMNEFEENILKSVRKPPLEMSEVHNLAGISKVFRCPTLSTGKLPEDLDPPTKRLYMGRWQKPIQTLSKYKDALATDLISIWDFEIDEDDKDFNITALNNTQKMETKVSGWLENTEDIAHSTMVNTSILNMTSIPFDVFNASNVTSGFGDTTFNESMNNKSQIDMEQSLHVAKPKVSKKKSRYIKGF